ncbi:MAG: MaoC family dehydratase [Alphaproteobacteria bacterium]|nr:MaoC family dehydratase [Alphaproteobacteria bacterium]
MGVLSEFYEDLQPDQRFELGSKTFDADYIKGFAAKYDPQSFHMDEEAAKKSHFGALCASGWQTISSWMRLYVDTNLADRAAREKNGEVLTELGVSPGIEQIKWMRPVYVGDEITYSQTIMSKRPLNSRPGWGLVMSMCEGVNQDGEMVLSFVSKSMVQTRV